MVTPPRRFAATLTLVKPLSDEVKLFRLGLSEAIDFTPGQYVSLRFPGDARYHAFSIASSPKIKGEIELIIKKEKEFTTKLFDQVEGTQLEGMGPMGRFMEDREEDVVMIAGGVGITPFLGLLRWVRDFGETQQQYWLFLCNRSRDRIVLEEELRQLDTLPNVHVVLSLTREQPEGWDGELGHFDKELLLKHLGSFEKKTFYTCGPGRLVEAMCAMLVEAGVPEIRVKRESWG